ncbi:MAG: Gfo/Idh/MocA family oxidoreductase [Armatimonadota bacterium]|jgi:predicted dehydrogenase
MKAIVVGLGGRAGTWLGECGRHEDVEIVGYVEPVEERRQAVAEKHNVPDSQLFADLADAAQAVEADFVVDVTPPAAHEAVANTAFGAGLHVLGEKPLSDDFEAAKRIVAASEAAGLTHMITQNYRFTLPPRTTRRLLAEGLIGAPEQVAIQFYMPWATRPGTHYVELPYMLIKDMGVHHFDMVRYVLDADPVSVQCVTWNPSWGWHKGDASHVALFDFDGGLRVVHTAFGSSVGRKTAWNGDWQIEGPEGSISWENDEIFHTRSFPGDKATREEIPPDDIALTGPDAILAEFVAAVKEGREPECSGRDNINSLAMTTAAVMSAEQGRKVEIGELVG